MPTATLRFDLSDQDDEREHRYALAGREALLALEAIEQHIRWRLKYGEPTEAEARLAEEIRGMIRDSSENLLD